MPIEIRTELHRPTQEEFTSLAYEVMACSFQVHREIGRFFDEKVYKRLVAQRFGGIELEVPAVVSHRDFRKTYFMDMVVRGQALFEWKSVERLSPEHRGQLLNYLLLCDLPNGKLLNVRQEKIDHEFVNTTLRSTDRKCLRTDSSQFHPLDATDKFWMEFLCEAVEDWGTGLDVHLYEAAIAHVLGREEIVLREIEVLVNGQIIGRQKARLTPSGAAFKVTAFQQSLNGFECHAQKFLMQTTLPAIHWVNV
jgi:GxxExxY protein